MTAFQIVATRKDGPDPDRRIDAVQLLSGHVLTIDEAINWINTYHHSFYTKTAFGPVATVDRVPATIYKKAYLTTSPDGILPNNLLHLPDIDQTLGGVLAQALRR